MQGSRRALLSGLSLGNFEVPDGWSASRPGGAEELVRFAIEVAKVGRGWVSSEKENRLLLARGQPPLCPYERLCYIAHCKLVWRAHIKCLFGLAATAKAGLISTGDKD